MGFNVPITDDGRIIDTRRIDMALPTLKYIIDILNLKLITEQCRT